MSTESTAITIPPKAMAEFALVETIAAACSLDVLGSQGHFARALTLARGIKALKEAITPQMIGEIMGLQGTSLGFLTDKDKDGGYDPDTVKECAIEAALRGAYWVGNEFNIIAGRAYMTKQFFKRKVREFPGLTDLKLSPGVPKLVGETGALVPYSATWKLHGLAHRIDRIECKLDNGTILDERICVKVNKGMGADGILGKAERKMLAAVYNEITGSDVTDGEAEDGARPLPSRTEGLADLTQRLNAPANGNGGEPKSDPDAELRADAAKVERLDQLQAEFEQLGNGKEVGAVSELLNREIETGKWSEQEVGRLTHWAETARIRARAARGGKGEQKTLQGTQA